MRTSDKAAKAKFAEPALRNCLEKRNGHRIGTLRAAKKALRSIDRPLLGAENVRLRSLRPFSKQFLQDVRWIGTRSGPLGGQYLDLIVIFRKLSSSANGCSGSGPRGGWRWGLAASSSRRLSGRISSRQRRVLPGGVRRAALVARVHDVDLDLVLSYTYVRRTDGVLVVEALRSPELEELVLLAAVVHGPLGAPACKLSVALVIGSFLDLHVFWVLRGSTRVGCVDRAEPITARRGPTLRYPSSPRGCIFFGRCGICNAEVRRLAPRRDGPMTKANPPRGGDAKPRASPRGSRAAAAPRGAVPRIRVPVSLARRDGAVTQTQPMHARASCPKLDSPPQGNRSFAPQVAEATARIASFLCPPGLNPPWASAKGVSAKTNQP